MKKMVPLAVAIAQVEAALDAAQGSAGTYADDPQGFHKRHRAQMEALAAKLTEDLGARFNDRWDGARVRMCGIVSTSTTGLSGALHNWLRAARTKVAHG